MQNEKRFEDYSSAFFALGAGGQTDPSRALSAKLDYLYTRVFFGEMTNGSSLKLRLSEFLESHRLAPSLVIPFSIATIEIGAIGEGRLGPITRRLEEAFVHFTRDHGTPF